MICAFFSTPPGGTSHLVEPRLMPKNTAERERSHPHIQTLVTLHEEFLVHGGDSFISVEFRETLSGFTAWVISQSLHPA